MDNIHDILLFVRLLLYPLVSYALILVAYSGRDGGRSKLFILHIFNALAFLALWGAAMLRFTGKGSTVVYTYLDFVMTPILLVICVMAWSKMVYYARRDLEKAIDNFNKQETDLSRSN